MTDIDKTAKASYTSIVISNQTTAKGDAVMPTDKSTAFIIKRKTGVSLRHMISVFLVCLILLNLAFDTRAFAADFADRTEYVVSQAAFAYVHDPSKNPVAMKDIVKDDTAIYGFRPSETGSLKLYADADWSDPEIVAKGREDRIAYHNSIASMYDMLRQMQSEGKSVEEIARAVSTRRNELRLESYKDNPEGLAALKQRNLEKYGHEEGPLPDELYEQYGSWEKVIEKAFSVNVGMDACLGLYDDYYDLYVLLGQVEDDSVPVYEISEIIGLNESGEWTKDTKDGVTFIVTSDIAGYRVYDHFTGIRIDGDDLTENIDYTVDASSPAVALKAETLAKLTAGDHTVTVIFDNGTAEASIAVRDADNNCYLTFWLVKMIVSMISAVVSCISAFIPLKCITFC